MKMSAEHSNTHTCATCTSQYADVDSVYVQADTKSARLKAGNAVTITVTDTKMSLVKRVDRATHGARRVFTLCSQHTLANTITTTMHNINVETLLAYIHYVTYLLQAIFHHTSYPSLYPDKLKISEQEEHGQDNQTSHCHPHSISRLRTTHGKFVPVNILSS